MTDDPDIRFATSLVDYLFRRLAVEYLDLETREAMGILTVGERLQPTLPGVEESVAPTARSVDLPLEDRAPSAASSEGRATTPPAAASPREVVLCHVCGDMMQRAGSCYACPRAGAPAVVRDTAAPAAARDLEAVQPGCVLAEDLALHLGPQLGHVLGRGVEGRGVEARRVGKSLSNMMLSSPTVSMSCARLVRSNIISLLDVAAITDVRDKGEGRGMPRRARRPRAVAAASTSVRSTLCWLHSRPSPCWRSQHGSPVDEHILHRGSQVSTRLRAHGSSRGAPGTGTRNRERDRHRGGVRRVRAATAARRAVGDRVLRRFQRQLA